MNGKTEPERDITAEIDETGVTGIDSSEPQPAMPRFSLRTMLIVVLTFCVVLAIVVPLLRRAREAARRLQCANNLKQIGLAMHNYHDIHRAFPPPVSYDKDGTPMHSWRVLITPFLEQSPFFDRYQLNEPWNGPQNGLLADDVPDTWMDKDGRPYQALYTFPTLRCPSAPRSQNRSCTNYVMVVKPDGTSTSPARFKGDDDSSSIMIVEIANSDIHWMEPRDLSLKAMSFRINAPSKPSISSYHVGGAFVVKTNGEVEFLDEAMTEEQLRKRLGAGP